MVSESIESWCSIVHHSHLWGRHTIPHHCLPLALFSCLPLGWSPEWVLLIKLLHLLFSQESLYRVLYWGWERELPLHEALHHL